MNTALADLLSMANVAIFGSLGVLSLTDAVICRLRYRKQGGDGWCWIKFVTGAIGLYWCWLYIFVLSVNPSDYDPVQFGRVFIRPAFLLTGGIMLMSAIIGARRRGVFSAVKGIAKREHQ